MDTNLHNYRKSYDKNQLIEAQLPEVPLELFHTWFKEVAAAGGIDEINAMTVSTIGIDGFPKSRIVLLKQFDQKGFVFYTNYTSDKGTAIAANNQVCSSFFWPNLERQVIIKGMAIRVSDAESTAYFNSRPRGSQLGAWASDQSTSIASRDILEEKLLKLEQQYADQIIPKPPHWGGYRIVPVSMEFWQGRPNRLHDRICYSKDNKGVWTKERLAP